MSVRRGNRIDGGQSEIVAAVRTLGAVWLPCVPPFACDAIVLWRSGVFFVEVKDGTKPPSARKLTENEKKLQAIVTAANCHYLIWESVDDAVGFLTGYRP